MRMYRLSQHSGELPPGSYYFGDPCYCFDTEDPKAAATWEKIVARLYERLNALFDNDGEVGVCPTMAAISPIAVIMHPNKWAVISPTAHGDGTYRFTPSRASVGVDSGTLAIMTPAFAAEVGPRLDLYKKFTQNSEFSISIINGDWRINDVVVCKTS